MRHIKNRLTIIGDAKDVGVVLENIRGAEDAAGTPRYIDFNRICPAPEELARGSAEWREWTLEHWGTTRNAYSQSPPVDDEKEINLLKNRFANPAAKKLEFYTTAKVIFEMTWRIPSDGLFIIYTITETKEEWKTSTLSQAEIKLNVEMASDYMERANDGDIDGQYRLGLAYKAGCGVEQSDTLSASWLAKAGERGHVSAQLRLGFLYEFGMQDCLAAAAWYRKAAKGGEVDAQYRLGLLLWLGNGVDKNMNEALVWLRKAAEQGSEAALQKLKELNVKVTPVKSEENPPPLRLL